MDEPLAGRVAAVAALDEPTRRRLYDHVVRQAEPVGRDEVADALRIPRANVAFHLDKLVEERLLDVAYERRSGRSGPGAGRPAKLYRRSQRHVAVSLPERSYGLAGHLLAAALEEGEQSGEPAREVLAQRAFSMGTELGENPSVGQDGDAGSSAVEAALEAQGFEPRTQDGQILLGNCPFHTLAQQHTSLVCGMNLSLVEGLLAGLGDTGWRAHLDPKPGQCCVRLAPASS